MIIFISTPSIIPSMMNEILQNPLFQSALAPLVVALATGTLLRPFGGKWAGLGFALGYAVSVYFTTGFQLFPLTSTRKIILLALGAVIIGALLDQFKYSRRYVPWVLVVLATVASGWVIWPVLKRAEGMELLLMSLVAVYAAWLVGWFDGLRNKQLAATSAAVSLGVGTGISAVLGASALLGQLGGAIGAAAGAMIVLQLFMSRIEVGRSFVLSAALLASLIGIAAVIYAGLPWYVLIPLAFIPVTARLPVKNDWNRFIQAFVLVSYTAVPAAIAVLIAWQMTQTVEPSLY